MHRIWKTKVGILKTEWDKLLVKAEEGFRAGVVTITAALVTVIYRISIDLYLRLALVN